MTALAFDHQEIVVRDEAAIQTHEINAVAAHLPWIVCLNGRIVAEGPPREIFTPEILKRTYNAEIHVTEYEGMKLVAESPHVFGRNDRGGNGAEGAHYERHHHA